jgi:hypothetical protein
MKIEKLVSQHRRDFVAVMKCEFCGHKEMDYSGFVCFYYGVLYFGWVYEKVCLDELSYYHQTL